VKGFGDVRPIQKTSRHRTPCKAVSPGAHVAGQLKTLKSGAPSGIGRFDRVWLAREVESKYIVAIKVMNKGQIQEGDIEIQLRREIEVQSRLGHPHVIRPFGYFSDETPIYLNVDYATRGSLFNQLLDNGRFDQVTAARFIC
jgi:serine/threonine protein kinase